MNEQPHPAPRPKDNRVHSSAQQALRRDAYWSRIREQCKPYFNDEGRYDGNAWQGGNARNYDQRIVVELAMPLLHGTDDERALAEKALQANELLIGPCAFNMDYTMALWHSSAERMSEAGRAWLLAQIEAGSETAVGLHRMQHPSQDFASTILTHRGHNLRDVQWHGYNDNHVALATSALILAGELVGRREDVDAGRASLHQLRDVLQRRGFINECNDCYLPHTMYPLAAIVEWARDSECRELAQLALERIWSDLIGHWHPNLGRKLGPSARDYTGGRLSGKGCLMFFNYVFGEDSVPGWLNLDDIFAPGDAPPERRMEWPYESGTAWNLGFIARLTAQPFVVPDCLVSAVRNKPYPYEIIGTNEFGNMLEIWEEVHPDGTKTHHGLDNVQYAGGAHLLTTYMEADWGMGTADQRLLGDCPNNNWQVSYRKQRPLDDIRQQGSWYCSYTINDKCVTEENHVQLIEGRPESKKLHGPIHWADAGRFAGIQHRRTAMLLYRPRPLEKWNLTSLALTLVYPLHYGNAVDELWFGDARVEDWQAESETVRDIFVKDGPVYIGFRPLMAPWRTDVDGPEPLACDIRMKAERRGLWGCVHLFNYRGPAIALRRECDLARIGNGFLAEVATEAEFPSLDAFKAWFRRGKVVDDTFHWQRQVRYGRPAAAGQPALDLGLRWDAWQDRIVSRTLNGRALPEPRFACTGMDNDALPWLTGPVADAAPTDWLDTLVHRLQHAHGHQPQPIDIRRGDA